MRKATEELLHEIKYCEDIRSFFTENHDEFLDMPAEGFLQSKLVEKKLSVADVIRNSNHGEYIYKVFAGTRRPSRDILISISFGLSLDIAETQTLLRLAGTARLDPRCKRDTVILYAILKKMSLNYLNELLYDMGEKIYY